MLFLWRCSGVATTAEEERRGIAQQRSPAALVREMQGAGLPLSSQLTSAHRRLKN